METTVYVDLFFMINFSMDFLCLFLTSKLLSLKLNLLRGIGAALFGGLYADLSLFIPISGVWGLALDAAAGVILCAIAFFRPKEWRKTPIYILVYTAVSMALGGIMTGLFNLFNKTSLFEGIKANDGDGISVWLFALLAVISGAITLFGGRFFVGRMARRRVYVELTYNGKTVKVNSFCDSGNLLREPISGKPCIVTDVSAISSIVPPDIVAAARNTDAFTIDRIGDEHRKRILLIPASTASGEGMLLGMRMDRIAVEEKGRTYEVDAVVALSCIGRGAEGCDALLPTVLLVR